MGRYRSFRSRDDEGETEGHKFEWFGNNRHVCDVLDDMRKCIKTHNYSLMDGLIEEAQVMANRMEAALSDQKDLVKLNREMSEARRAYKDLEREYKKLESKVKPFRPKKDKS